MSKSLVSAYQVLPPWAQSLAAAGRGAYLRYWRYDHRTERLVREALARESWTAEQWQQWRQERLARILLRASTRVPFYREYWAGQSASAKSKPWLNLKNWPILEKESLRKNPRAFLVDGARTGLMFAEHTSGTSGTPLTLWRTRGTQREFYALLEARMRRWHGITRRDRWAILGGQLVAPVTRKRPPFWVWNPALHQLYMSSFHLSPEFAPYYLDALKAHKVKYLLGYTSALEFLARETLRLKRTDMQMQVVLTNAEPVSDHQREVIAQAFQCALRDSYGMAEMVAASSECCESKMHLWPEVGMIEVINGDDSVPDGLAGDLVCTGLLNEHMPLIRYRVGDRGTLAPQNSERCACGRLLPVLASIEGRADDVVCTADGRRIGRLDPIFKGGFPIIEAQVVQESLTRLRVRYVPAANFSRNSGDELKAAVRNYVGPMEIVLEPLAQIPREKNGKFRAVVSNLTAAERASKAPESGKMQSSATA